MVFVEFQQFIVIILIEQGIFKLSYFVIYVQFFYVLVYCLIQMWCMYMYVQKFFIVDVLYVI